MINPFFNNNGPFKISDILLLINLDDLKINKDQEICDIKDLKISFLLFKGIIVITYQY